MFHDFFAAQVVKLEVPSQQVSIQKYLQKPQRVVRAIGASSHIEPIGEDAYRLSMRPVKFFMLGIEPTVDLKVWTDGDGTIRLDSTACELRGIETMRDHFSLQLNGDLTPYEMGGTTYLQGGAQIAIKIYLPPPFSFMPKGLVESTGNSLLGGILLRMKQRLMHQLLLDYDRWATQQAEALVAA
ncbi:MAG: DUF1997 domain-containing protein [Coleofasciculaceae cyanobacterium SM2_3_26]|nr:DUF1997 domain-containing protein [Coleofasciculaceae cyanobacterium SM2_3_26]